MAGARALFRHGRYADAPPFWDHARKHLAGKRGAGFEMLPLDEQLAFAPERAGPLVQLDEALQRLTQSDPRAGRVVELRFFGGLSVEETAEAMQISERTVQRGMGVWADPGCARTLGGYRWPGLKKRLR